MTAIIVDNEKHCREVLEHLLVKYCAEVKLLANCANAAEALDILKSESPDILFLDIEMPGMNGFEMLEHCTGSNFEIIFTTAYNEDSIQVIKHSGLDYLLKPIDKDELVQSVQRTKTEKAIQPSERLQSLLEHWNNKKPTKRIKR